MELCKEGMDTPEMTEDTDWSEAIKYLQTMIKKMQKATAVVPAI